MHRRAVCRTSISRGYESQVKRPRVTKIASKMAIVITGMLRLNLWTMQLQGILDSGILKRLRTLLMAQINKTWPKTAQNLI